MKIELNQSMFSKEIQNSVDFLNSDKAQKIIKLDPYWPKWDSPWWHMSLLHEIGETKLIPESILKIYVDSLNKMPLKIFPIYPEDSTSDIDPYRGSPCHCQLGNVYQVLAAWGLNVDQELPWIRPWFLRYQMADGGLNCDHTAYLVRDEIPSSMVGTISAFEAILLHTKNPWTAEEKAFLDKGAHFLMSRKLMLGSETAHNASERESAKDWFNLCFPRFYFYDVLRGLCALLIWSEKTQQNIAPEFVRAVIENIDKRFPNGEIVNGRKSYQGTGTILQNLKGDWIRQQTANDFPLLSKVSVIGDVSPFLSRHWRTARSLIARDNYLKNLILG